MSMCQYAEPEEAREASRGRSLGQVGEDGDYRSDVFGKF